MVTQNRVEVDPVTKKVTQERNHLTMGLGLHKIEFEGVTLQILHQIAGMPGGTDRGVEQKLKIIVFAPNTTTTTPRKGEEEEGGQESEAEKLLKRFCDLLVQWDELDEDPETYTIHQWFAEGRGYWDEMSTRKIRPASSVVLPAKLKESVLADVSNFCS